MKLDPFYLIVDSANWIERLVPLGVKLVQLRIKSRPISEVRAELKKSVKICDKFGCSLVINDYWQLAIEERCKFVHLGQEDLAAAEIDAIRVSGLKVGISTHDDAELATALKANADYVALGPIYATKLKKMPWKPQTVDRLRIWKNIVGDVPLVAIGGLNVARLRPVFENGADSAAVVTDIIKSNDPERRTIQWLNAVRQQRYLIAAQGEHPRN